MVDRERTGLARELFLAASAAEWVGGIVLRLLRDCGGVSGAAAGAVLGNRFDSELDCRGIDVVTGEFFDRESAARAAAGL